MKCGCWMVLDGEVFTEGERGDGVGVRVTKWGEVTATGPGGPPDLHVRVSGFPFTAIMWKVSRIVIIVRQYVPDW